MTNRLAPTDIGQKRIIHHRTADIYCLYIKGYMRDPLRKLYLQPKHLRAVNRSQDCRVYGSNAYACTDCGEVKDVKMSCHHRFCARCGAAASNKWAEKLTAKLLPILHGHLVFTLPFFLRSLAKRNERVIYEALFNLSAQAVKEILWEKYGVNVGIICVLHTYGSDLKYHPHIHMIVSCGGVRHNCMQAMKKAYLCDHEVLAQRFETLFKAHLCTLYTQNALNTEGVMEATENMADFIEKHNKQNWIVGMNLGIQDTQKLIGYCGRYLRRACLSEYRIQSIDKGEISFTFKDYKNTPRGEKPIEGVKTMTSTAFLDALLQHVPDKGFIGVRYYGIYANASKALVKCGYIKPKIQDNNDIQSQEQETDLMRFRRTQEQDILMCTCCGIERTLISSSMKGVIFKTTHLFNDS